MMDGFAYRRIATSGTEINLAVGGEGPPLLLLHGFPETHLMWHRVAPKLAERFTVVAPDLRGYGDSGKPAGGGDHADYAKRAMALDMVEVMAALGHERFRLVAHDRGARVAHRLAIDHPERVEKLCLMDIIPGSVVYGTVTRQVASAYWHWFFLIQPAPFPEHFIGLDPDYLVRSALRALSPGADPVPPEVLAEYLRVFRDPATIHAVCEDYRAGASIDCRHEEEDRTAGRRIACPTLVLWGSKGLVGRAYDPLKVWGEVCADLRGAALDCGHFLPEEAPDAVLAALDGFL
ncbi:MAG TPA: alpha/beta hydrolase [Azospirillaceae bacterium]|nr:alpha/beta hydrolase [Azospirillaceae bacterium]